MSQRLPVIATPTGGAVGLVRNGETGLLIAPRSTDEMAAAMQRLLDDRALGRQIAETAYAMAQGYTWTRTAELTLQSYEKAVAWRRERP
jgi:glycosyltransferase involved in cell wall biosynthesis